MTPSSNPHPLPQHIHTHPNITDNEKKTRILLDVRIPSFNFTGLNVIKFDAEKIIKAVGIKGWDVTKTRPTCICIYMYMYIILINYVVQGLD